MGRAKDQESDHPHPIASCGLRWDQHTECCWPSPKTRTSRLAESAGSRGLFLSLLRCLYGAAGLYAFKCGPPPMERGRAEAFSAAQVRHAPAASACMMNPMICPSADWSLRIMLAVGYADSLLLWR